MQKPKVNANQQKYGFTAADVKKKQSQNAVDAKRGFSAENVRDAASDKYFAANADKYTTTGAVASGVESPRSTDIVKQAFASSASRKTSFSTGNVTAANTVKGPNTSVNNGKTTSASGPSNIQSRIT
jgi:hypothetical protein